VVGIVVEERNQVALAEQMELSVSACAELPAELMNPLLIHL
jgi:hypothetical protein